MRLTESIEAVKPRALKKGDTIGITAPSSQINIKSVSNFARHLQELGFEVVLGSTITTMKDNHYNSGNVQERAEDLNAMLKDRSIRAVFAGAGGFGAQQTTRFVDFGAIEADPKPIIGFSDTTFLLNSITERAGITTFLGPTAELSSDADKHSIDFCIKLITGEMGDGFVVPNFDGSEIRRISKPNLQGIGRLVGGNLTMMQATIGTENEIDTDGKIILLEEVNESSYAVERILDHLISAGKFDNVRGVVLGEFTNVQREQVKDQHDSNPSVNEILVKKFGGSEVPVLIGYNFSHGTYNLTMPLGCVAKVDSANRTLEIIDRAVR